MKEAENRKIHEVEQKYEEDMKSIREEMNQQVTQIISTIQQNPQLANIKPEILTQKRIDNHRIK